jgi:hypothetical protein
VAAVVVFGVQALGRSSLARSPTAGDDDAGDGACALEASIPDSARAAIGMNAAGLIEALGRADEAEGSRIVDSLGSGGRPLLERGFDLSPDDDLRLTVARHLARVYGPAAGTPLLLRLLCESDAPYVRSEAAATIVALAGRAFEGYDPGAGAEANDAALEAKDRWLQTLSN